MLSIVVKLLDYSALATINKDTQNQTNTLPSTLLDVVSNEEKVCTLHSNASLK